MLQHPTAFEPPALVAADFADTGYDVVPRLFAPEELDWLVQEARTITLRLSGRPKVRERGNVSGRSVPGVLADVDIFEEPFRRLASHPRLVQRVEALLGGQVNVQRTSLVQESPAVNSCGGVMSRLTT